MLGRQTTPVALPHILAMNMMFNFAVILLHRPDYCNGSRVIEFGKRTRPNAAGDTTDTVRCDQAAYVDLHGPEQANNTDENPYNSALISCIFLK